MDLSSLLNGPIGQTVISSIAGKLGMDENQAANVVNTAVPVILGGLNKNARTEEGAASLNKALEKHDGGILDNLMGMLGGDTQELEQDGGGILGHVFGDKQSQVEEAVAKKSGISMAQVGPILAILAPIVMGYLGKQKNQSNTGAGGLGDLIGGLLGGGGQKQSSGGGLMGMISGLLDKDKDGSPIDDILEMFTK
ncbi:conserved hypothetical protein [uncultured Paludibacter sp.]|uniref:DUF937 domain-containing protein n=1 Tax=uncultured Paludibacter sp. TaxID=497635 RepID=A0A653A6X0_9BACT|nr:conserved hypothetical protein [uncultured Paludibacter sp.]